MIDLVFDGQMYFNIVEEDGTQNKVEVPRELVEDMLKKFMNSLFEPMLAETVEEGTETEASE